MHKLILATGIFCICCVACEENGSPTVLTCTSQEDCSSHQICFWGTCRDDNQAISLIFAQVIPPSNSDFLKQQITEPFDLSIDNEISIQLQNTVQIQGSTSNLTRGLIIAENTNAILNLPISHSTNINSGIYAINLTPEQYNFSIFPPNTNLPPYYETITIEEQQTELNWNYPEETQLFVLQGRLLYSLSNATGVADASVAVIGDNDTLLSNKVTTDETDGTFRMLVTERPESIVLQFRPTQDNLLVPEMDIPVGFIPESGNLGDFEIGALLQLSNINGLIKGYDGQSLHQAQVMFTADIGNGEFYHTNFSYNGWFNTDLWAGIDYNITVIPPPHTHYGIATSQVSIPDTSNQTIEITLPSKRQITGIVVSYDNQPIENVTVQAQRLCSPARICGSQLQWETTTSETGAFSLLVERGSIQLTFIPDILSGQPMKTSTLSIDQDVTLSVSLHQPAYAYGTVTDQEQNPISNVTLSFYSFELSATDAPIRIATTITDQDGSFQIAIPNPATQSTLTIQ